MPSGARLATLWVAPLTFLVHLAGVRPGLVGAWTDDAIYLGMGTSLARAGTLAVPILPGAPEVAKYPLGWPAVIALVDRLGFDVTTEAGLQVLLGVNALFWALAAQVVVDGLLPRLGASLGARVAVGLLLAVNAVTMQFVGTAMSEALFTLAFVSAMALGWSAAASPRRATLGALAVAVATMGLARSVASPLALVGLLLALAAGRRPVAAAVFVGWLVQALVVRVERASVTAPPDEARAFLHYFVSYDEHTAWYTDPLKAGDFPLLVERLLGVVGRNLETAPRALAGLYFPADYVGDAPSDASASMTALGVAGFLLAIGAAVRTPKARGLILLLCTYVGIFLLWTWPFSTRFWMPVFPLLAVGLVLTLSAGGNIGRAVLWPIVGALVVGNSFVPYYRIQHLLAGSVPGAPTTEDAALDDGTAWMAARVRPADVIAGDHLSVWLARKLGTQTVELAAMLRSEDHLGLMLGLVDPAAQAPRLADDLGASFTALEGAVGPDASVWVALIRRRNAKVGPLLDQLTAQGRLEWQGEQGVLSVWRLARPAAGAPP